MFSESANDSERFGSMIRHIGDINLSIDQAVLRAKIKLECYKVSAKAEGGERSGEQYR